MSRKIAAKKATFLCFVVMLSLITTPVLSATLTIPQNKLLDTEFDHTRWGGSVVTTDLPGCSVQFAFTGLTDSGTGLKDDYPIDTIYGQILPSHASGDFTNFTAYALRFENTDSNAVSVSVFINTGFTGPSGIPSNEPNNNTFWQSQWTQIPPGQTKIVTLDFNNAVPWSIEDNPVPHTQGTNGIATSINDFDRAEVSAIGFEVAGPNENADAVLRISSVEKGIEFKGVSYTPWAKDAMLSEASDKSLEDARDIGCNWIAICVWWFQDDINSTVIEPDYSKYSASPESVIHAIKTCHKLGMKVALKPMLDCRDGSWRGYINPSTQWFNEYHNFINYWADIAQNNNVELFCAGCEFVNTISWSTQWRSVIADLRTHYIGPVTYAANHGQEQNIDWWDALDYIGIDAYYALTSNNNPTLNELNTAWNDRANQIQTWKNSNWPKLDIIFTEVGYQSVDGTNKTPWWTDPAGDIDLQEQADCYHALLSQCKDRNWFKGAFWWNWETEPNAGGTANPYHPMQNKPAQQILENYYIINIDTDAPNDPGTGIAGDPFLRLQDAINYASSRDILLVADGTYTGIGNRDLNFHGNELHLKSQNGPDTTIINCQASESQQHRAFYFHSAETQYAVVEGLSLFNGYYDKGGAIYCDSNCCPIIKNCIIAANNAAKGGAAYCHNSNTNFINCTIIDNNATETAGAFYCSLDSPKITNSIIQDNSPNQIQGDASVDYCNINSTINGFGNIDTDPCFVSYAKSTDPNLWDLHLKSDAGAWDTNSQSWISHAVTSRAVDAGNPAYHLEDENDDANNIRINIGAFGGTAQASKSPKNWSVLNDLSNDGIVNSIDYAILSKNWYLNSSHPIGDTNRDDFVGPEDLVKLADDWLNKTNWYD